MKLVDGVQCPECDAPIITDCSVPWCPFVCCTECQGNGMACHDHRKLIVWYSTLGETIEGPCDWDHQPEAYEDWPDWAKA